MSLQRPTGTLDSLPHELLIEIVPQLRVEDFLALAQTSKRLQAFISGNVALICNRAILIRHTKIHFDFKKFSKAEECRIARDLCCYAVHSGKSDSDFQAIYGRRKAMRPDITFLELCDSCDGYYTQVPVQKYPSNYVWEAIGSMPNDFRRIDKLISSFGQFLRNASKPVREHDKQNLQKLQDEQQHVGAQ